MAATLWREPRTPEDVGGTLLPVSWEITYKWKEDNQVFKVFLIIIFNIWSVPDHAGLQLLEAAGCVRDLGEQRKESLNPLELQGQQRTWGVQDAVNWLQGLC